MSRYKAIIAYENEYGNTQHHVVKDIIAIRVPGAFEIAMDDFYAHLNCEIKKVIIELQMTEWETYCGS